MVSTQTVTQGVSAITSAGAYKTPASGKSLADWGSHKIALYTLTTVTTDATGGITFDPRAQGFPQTPALVTGWYQPAGSADHQYIIQGWDPVNLILKVWDLTDNDQPNGDSPAGQFVVLVVAE
jgi:hypothetical protein